MSAYLQPTPRPERQVQYPTASWACPYHTPWDSQLSYRTNIPSIVFPPDLIPQLTEQDHGWPRYSHIILDSWIPGLPSRSHDVVLLAFQAPSPIYSLLRISILTHLHCFPSILIIFQFFKPGLQLQPLYTCFPRPRSFSSLHLHYALPGLFSAQFWGLSFSLSTSWEAFPDHPSLLCAPVTPPYLISAYHILGSGS